MAHTGDSNKGTSSGHTFSDLVTPNATFPNPGARNTSDPSWVRRNQEWQEATTPQQKFAGGD
jgi:hypothetical protein